MSLKSAASETPLAAAAPVSPVTSDRASRDWSDPPPIADEALAAQAEELPSAEATFAAQSTNRPAPQLASDAPTTTDEAVAAHREQRASAEAIFATQSTSRAPPAPSIASQSVQQPPREARQTTPVGHALTPAESAAYIARARAKIQQGDIAGARRLLERASESGEGDALFALAETYDPRMLAKWGVLGTKPDLALAKELYSKAANGGTRGATERLLALGH